jgi:hypothetical protein
VVQLACQAHAPRVNPRCNRRPNPVLCRQLFQQICPRLSQPQARVNIHLLVPQVHPLANRLCNHQVNRSVYLLGLQQLHRPLLPAHYQQLPRVVHHPLSHQLLLHLDPATIHLLNLVTSPQRFPVLFHRVFHLHHPAVNRLGRRLVSRAGRRLVSRAVSQVSTLPHSRVGVRVVSLRPIPPTKTHCRWRWLAGVRTRLRWYGMWTVWGTRTMILLCT